MGHEESPGLANLFLYSKEKSYVDRKLAELGEDEVISRYYGFQYHRRFIDDLFAPVPKEDLPSEADYGLRLAVTGHGTQVVFLGILVTIDGDRLIYRARDKQQGFAFKITRFPSWKSCVPAACKRGTIMGMLARTLNLTTTTDDFVSESRLILRLFADRRYPHDFVKESVRRFLAKNIVAPARARLLTLLLAEEDVVRSSSPPPPPGPAAGPATAADESASDSDAPPPAPRLRLSLRPLQSTSSTQTSTEQVPERAPPAPPAEPLRLSLKILRSPSRRRARLSKPRRSPSRSERNDIIDAPHPPPASPAAPSSDLSAGQLASAFASALELHSSVQQHNSDAQFGFMQNVLSDLIAGFSAETRRSVNDIANSLQASVHSTVVELIDHARAPYLQLPGDVASVLKSLSGSLHTFQGQLMAERTRSEQFVLTLQDALSSHRDSVKQLVDFNQSQHHDCYTLLQRLEDSRTSMWQSSSAVMDNAVAQIASVSQEASQVMRSMAQHAASGGSLDATTLASLLGDNRDFLQHLLSQIDSRQEGVLQRVIVPFVESALSRASAPLRIEIAPSSSSSPLEIGPTRAISQRTIDELSSRSSSVVPAAPAGESSPRKASEKQDDGNASPQASPPRPTVSQPTPPRESETARTTPSRARGVSPLPSQKSKSLRRETSPEPTPPRS